MNTRRITVGIALAAVFMPPLGVAFSLTPVGSVSQPRPTVTRVTTSTRSQPSSGADSVPIRLTIPPFLSFDGCGGIVTPCHAWVFVPPPCDGKLKTVVTTFTLHHNMNLDVTAWRCGAAGSNRAAPASANSTTYKIEFLTDASAAPFYTYGPATLPSLTPVSLTNIAHAQSLGTVRVRVTRTGKTPKSLEGDWLTLMFSYH